LIALDSVHKYLFQINIKFIITNYNNFCYKMKIALCQYNPEWENKDVNKQRIEKLLAGTKEKFEVLILPELTLTGFTMKASRFGEDLNEETFNFYAGIAKQYGCNVLGGISEKNSGKFYNTLIHVDSSGELVSSYRKIHPFSYSTEDKHYTRGNTPKVTQVKSWKVGLSICYDLRFPELYRQYAKEKAELIVCIANWPDTRIHHWRILLQAYAIANQCYVAGVNRVGDDPKLHYNGFSSVFDPMGKELTAVEDEEKIIIEDVSIENVQEVRKKLPFLDDIHLI